MRLFVFGASQDALAQQRLHTGLRYSALIRARQRFCFIDIGLPIWLRPIETTSGKCFANGLQQSNLRAQCIWSRFKRWQRLVSVNSAVGMARADDLFNMCEPCRNSRRLGSEVHACSGLCRKTPSITYGLESAAIAARKAFALDNCLVLYRKQVRVWVGIGEHKRGRPNPACLTRLVTSQSSATFDELFWCLSAQGEGADRHTHQLMYAMAVVRALLVSGRKACIVLPQTLAGAACPMYRRDILLATRFQCIGVSWVYVCTSRFPVASPKLLQQSLARVRAKQVVNLKALYPACAMPCVSATLAMRRWLRVSHHAPRNLMRVTLSE